MFSGDVTSNPLRRSRRKCVEIVRFKQLSMKMSKFVRSMEHGVVYVRKLHPYVSLTRLSVDAHSPQEGAFFESQFAVQKM